MPVYLNQRMAITVAVTNESDTSGGNNHRAHYPDRAPRFPELPPPSRIDLVHFPHSPVRHATVQGTALVHRGGGYPVQHCRMGYGLRSRAVSSPLGRLGEPRASDCEPSDAHPPYPSVD